VKIIDMHNRNSKYTVRCDRTTILGNPCSRPGVTCPICNEVHFDKGMKQLTHCRSIQCYRTWLWIEFEKGNKKLIAAIKAIKRDDTLACWCCERIGTGVFDRPEMCHCQVIWKAWSYLHEG
jgi:hypothetical protein